jgi:pimeloyl-ACP methyl ester carboxylesterase
MAMIHAGDIDIHVQRLAPAGVVEGEEAPVVVFIHGLLTDSLASYYFTLGPTFAEQGVDVVMYDLRGHGRSTRPASGYRLEHFVEDLRGLLDGLGIDRPVHLVGNSFGGSVAYGMAAAHPDRVASVTAIEAEPPVARWTGHMAEGLGHARSRLVEDEVIDWIAQNNGAHTARLSKLAGRILETTTMAQEIPLSAPMTDDLSTVRCPVFALFGDESGLAAQVPELQTLLEHCQTVVLPEQGHSVLVERTEETATLVLEWVRKNSVALMGAN